MSHYYYGQLPTVEEAQNFLRIINVGRAAVEAEPLDKLNWADSDAGSSSSCLSATNLFCIAEVYDDPSAPFGAGVGSQTVTTSDKIAEALNLSPNGHHSTEYVIPQEILVVTDPFDDRHPGLEDRLREAGVIE